MLAPDDRSTLVDCLRPPPGFALDLAVGTTYTLNLTTLLVVPTAYAMFPTGDVTGEETDSGGEPDARLTPVGLLDALRRVSGRLTIFCDAAQIAPPVRTRRVLLGLVEETVVPVVAPHGGAFHPKLWALRFRDQDGEVLHRLLIGTRNLTFDGSWDTMVMLESDPHATPVAGAGELLRGLSRTAGPVLTPTRRHVLQQFAEELDGVGFATPAGFELARLHTFGIDAQQPWPFPKRCDRLLVVSPFLSPGALQRLPAASQRRVLVSRRESLECTPAADEFECYELAPDLVAEQPADEASATDPARALVGLHAKLYVTETGGKTRWWTGSANATDAAYGHNVETLLELRSSQAPHTVTELLRQRKGGDDSSKTFRDLLLPWSRVTEPVQASADDLLDDVRRQVAAIGFTATVTALDADRYRVTYTSDGPVGLPPDVELRCWPATDTRPDEPTALDADATLRLETTAVLSTLTAFLVVEVSGGGTRTACTLRCQLVGAPEHRQQRLIAYLLADPDRLLRYLLALLSDDQTLLSEQEAFASDAATWHSNGMERLPLLERMVKALVQEPAKLAEVSELLTTIQQGGVSLPAELAELWQSVWQVARQRTGGTDAC